MKRHLRSILTLTAAITVAGQAAADRILDVSYFDDVGHRKLTFNTDGAGDPIRLSKGDTKAILEDEYARQGLKRFRIARWGRDGTDEFEKLLEEVASAPIYALASATQDDYTVFEFDPLIADFGLWVFRNTRNPRPIFDAYDAERKLIESAAFDNDAIDGVVKIGSETVEYGFIGIAADREIARIEVSTGPIACDDLYYTPEPSAALLLLLAGAGALRRR